MFQVVKLILFSKMKIFEKYLIIYLSPIINHSAKKIDLVVNTAKALSVYCQVLYIPINQKPLSLKNCLMPSNMLKILKNINHIKKSRFIEWQEFCCLPFQRFKNIKILNKYCHLYLLKKFLLRNKKIIIFSSSPDNKIKNIIRILKPIAVLADRFDIWERNEFLETKELFNYYISNSQWIYKGQKAEITNLLSIPEGHVSKNSIKKLYFASKNNKLRKTNKKIILLICTVTWRINIKLLIKITEKFPNYRLLIIGAYLLNNKFSNDWNDKNKQSIKLWEKLLTKKNCQFIPITNQDDLAKLKIKASLGIIPYDTKYDFNKYCHPIKLYHYFAMGIPILSTKIKPILKYKSRYCHFADNQEIFISKIPKIISLETTKTEKKDMFDIAIKQTYQQKAATIIKFIRDKIIL